VTKKRVIFSIEYFLGIFSIGLIFSIIPEEVISSGEVSEGNIVLRVLMKVLLR
jgi:hypothetical protein